MSIKIKTDKKLENFSLHGSFEDSTGGSNDGMRRSYSYTVHTTTTFSFENEQLEEDGKYTYDLTVIKSYDDGRGRNDYTYSEEYFLKYSFGYILGTLRNRGVKVLNHTIYVAVGLSLYKGIDSSECKTAPDENVIVLDFDGDLCPLSGETEVLTAKELLSRLGEKDEQRKNMMIARAIEDYSNINKRYLVPIDSISSEMSEKRVYIKLKKFTIKDLLSRKLVNKAAISRNLTENLENEKRFSIKTEGLEEVIAELPPEYQKKVLSQAKMDASNVQLFRDYYPEGIRWDRLGSNDFIWSDLDLMAEQGVAIWGDAEWSFIERCMEIPDLERKIVKSAYSFGRNKLDPIAKGLKTCGKDELLRVMIDGIAKEPKKFKYDNLASLTRLDFEGLDKADYEACLVLIAKEKVWDHEYYLIRFLLKLGRATNISDEKLFEMILKVKEFSTFLKLEDYEDLYEEFNLEQGINLVREHERWIEEERREEERQKQESNRKVVEYVKNSGKLAVPVITRYDNRFIINTPNREYIGKLDRDEKSIVMAEGRSYKYLINVERVQKLRNGVFHLDISEEDTGVIIGKKGANIRELTEKLNSLGCNLRLIKVHPHETVKL
ncbi:hypothetical protein IJ096_03440 [Candidatus Saccharibacteria bacterium]|nr:hypothetical protein [Candidatus Saccharibacteria bacterium]